ncbi:MAG: methylenetetrahydrofolate reductase C-terminal domain-containing protein [Promethearchaeota archaeon]
MIITDNKPWKEVKYALDDFKIKRLVLASCGICAAKVGTGGTEGAAKMKKKLEEEGYEVITVLCIDEPCDNRMAKQAFRKIKEELEESDGVMSLACGLGTQSMAKLTKFLGIKPVITALDTIFMGETERMGKFFEVCRACGECYLNETGGICPITRCAKSMLNGPCGGSVEGKCEVGNYTKPCGWVEIYEKLKEMGRLDLFLKIRKPRDWSLSSSKRELIIGREGPIPGIPSRPTSPESAQGGK